MSVRKTMSSTELINFYSMTDSEMQTFITFLKGQNIPLVIARLNAYNEWSSGTSSGLTAVKKFINYANAQNIEVSVDLHTWYTTWDDYFRDSASNSSTNRSKYLTYVSNVITNLSGSNVFTYMVLNEPQARTATASENQFILSILSTARNKTAKPLSVRFMAGYSPSTGHYSSSIDTTCNYLCRNAYWDPRNPSTVVYGCSEAKLINAISVSHSQGKEIWITEFGAKKTDLENQRDYVEHFVDWSKSVDTTKGKEIVDKIFCWVSQPEGGSSESYNIFTDYIPNPAFYELINDGGEIEMVSKTFSGKLSIVDVGAKIDGVTVKIAVTGDVVDNLTAVTDTSGNYSVTKEYSGTGTKNCSAIASVDADSENAVVSSITEAFQIVFALLKRALSLVVS